MWRVTFTCSLFSVLFIESNMLSLQEDLFQSTIEKNNEARENEVKIIGGLEVQCKDFPYQINFVVSGIQFCGGFIVSDRYILTAAHCALGVDPSTVVLRAGSTFRTNGTIIPVEEVTPFPGYNHPSFDKDIAVIKTSEPIKYDECTQPIPLIEKGKDPDPGSTMTVSGWGITALNGTTLTNHLMAVNLTVIERYRCKDAYRNMVTDNMICAGDFINGGKGPCMGDSGGVGVVDGIAIGIVSWSRDCGGPSEPNVFADISSPILRDFVTKMTGL